MDSGHDLAAQFATEADALRRIARALLVEPAMADDAVQEAWLAALEQQGPVSGGWLVESVRRTARSLRRREARTHRRERLAAREEALPAADETAARMDALRQIVEALDTLEEPYRSAIRLRYLDDLSIDTVARRLGAPQETVRTQLRRGLQRMRARLDVHNAERRDAFLSALAPFALGADQLVRATALARPLHSIGGAAMSTPSKLAAAALVAWLAAIVGWRMVHTRAESSSATLDAATAVDSAHDSSTSSAEALETAAHASRASERASVASAPAEGGEWIARGRVLLGTERGFAGARLRVKVAAGYEGDGDTLFDELVVADEVGEFEFGLEPPTGAVRIHASSADSSCIGWNPTTLVPTDAPPPQDLSVRLYPLDRRIDGRVLDEAGEALAGARIAGFSEPVIADAEGRFSLLVPSLFSEPRVDAWADGFALRTTVLHGGGATPLADVEIRLKRCALLRGVVVDEFGAPVENAKVRGGFAGRTAALTNARGEFEIDHLSDDETFWIVRVSAVGFASSQVQIEGAEERAKALQIVLQRGVDVFGRVVDDRGRALPGALVYAGFSPDADPRVNAVSHDDGAFVLRNVSRDEVRVGAQLEGYAPHATELRLPERGPFVGALQLVLTQGVTLRGRVADDRGESIGRAAVSVLVDGEFGATLMSTCDEHGRFEIHGVPAQADLRLHVSATGFVYARQPVDDASAEQVVVMQRAAGLAGRVVDGATGAPVRRFRVRFVAPTLEPGERALVGYTSSWSEEGVLFDDPNGEWDTRAESLPVGGVVGVEIRAEGYGPAILPHAVSTFDPAAERLIATLGAGANVSGRLVDAATGAPVPNARVTRVAARELERGRRPSGDDVESAHSDATGSFVLEALPRESLWLFVESDSFAQALDGPIEMPADGDPAPRTIALSVGGRIAGELRDAAGAARVGVTVNVAQLNGRRPFTRDVELTTDELGRFEVDRLAPGPHQVSVALEHEHGTVYDLARTIEVHADAETRVELRPGGRATLAGVLTSSMTLPAECPITLRRKSGDGEESSMWRAAIARDGRFEVEGLEAGVWSVSASLQLPTADRKILMGATEVSLDADERESCSIEIRLVR